MFRQWFNWLVLSCFIAHVALYCSTSHFTGKPLTQLEELVEEHYAEAQEEEDSSPIQLMLLEYLDLIEDFPRAETAKPQNTKTSTSIKLGTRPVQQKPIPTFAQAVYAIWYIPLAYSPQHFLLSEYHGYLFRFTLF